MQSVENGEYQPPATLLLHYDFLTVDEIERLSIFAVLSLSGGRECQGGKVVLVGTSSSRLGL